MAYVAIVLMLLLGALAIGLALRTTAVDGVEIAGDPIEEDDPRLPYGGGFGG